MILQMADPVKELKEIRFTSEKEMQHFCEKNMEQMLGLQFIASEFRVAQFRFDSVAYNPVKYSLQGTTQGNGLTGGVPPVRFSM